MTSVLDKRVQVEGALKDDKVYNEEGRELKPIAPKNNKEEKQIEEMMQRYPQLDYLMCLLLIQATSEELEEITKNPKPRQLDTSTIIKQDFYPEEQPNLNNLVIS
jgi:hypothetical protein